MMSLPHNPDVILVSDVHMRTVDDERGLLLLDLITDIQGDPPQYFILLGDIFDFCLGSTTFFRRKFAPVGAALSELAAKGTRVIFFEGNHEFELPKLNWPGVEFVGEGSANFELESGITIRAAHGDLVHSTRGYRLFRRFLKSAVIRFAATYIVPSRWLDAYALSHAKFSRAQDHYRAINHNALLNDTTEWIGAASIGMIGHFHTPYYETLSESKHLISVRDWSQPNFLVIKDRNISRGIYTNNSWTVTAAERSNFGHQT